MEIRKRSKNEKRGLWGDNWNKQILVLIRDRHLSNILQDVENVESMKTLR
jgi:hypothetical protein